MRVLVLAVVLSGCGHASTDSTSIRPEPAREATVTLIMAGEPPREGDHLVAYRDGDGVWNRVPFQERISFRVRSGRYTVVNACPIRDDHPSVHIYQRTTADDARIEIEPCNFGDFGYVHGTITGARGPKTLVHSGEVADRYNVYVPAGMHDLVVSERVQRAHGWTTTRLAVIRDINVAAWARVEVDVDLSTAAVDLEHHRIDVDGVRKGESVSVRTHFAAARGWGTVFLTLDEDPPLVADVPPASILAPGDKIDVEIVAAQIVGPTWAGSRGGARWAVRRGARYALADPLGGVNVDRGTVHPSRLRFTWPAYKTATTYGITVFQTDCDYDDECAYKHPFWGISVSRRWLGDGDRMRYDLPDLTEIPGWPSDLELDRGAGFKWYLSAKADESGRVPLANRHGYFQPWVDSPR